MRIPDDMKERKLKKVLSKYITPISLGISPMFEFYVNGNMENPLKIEIPFIIEIDEPHEKFVDHLKEDLKKQVVLQQNLDKKI